ncbi:unnamed protein product [Brachionus calyciflorus]|uniref:Uncharacterized protein n=1 Tax=Brachionus calyciflorus TaxID=104777 RepID=A0A813MMJ2_9BILA|nr:unnamed protein product [Brachionus calyciflorus]
MAPEYKRQFNAALDALYAKEIQDIHSNFLDTSITQNERNNELKSSLKRFSQKVDTLKFRSAPLAICILNVINGLSSQTRNNLDIQVIQDIKKILLSLYNIFKHSIFADDLVNKEGEGNIGEEDDYDRILFLIFETCFNIAHDGIKYRKSREIFNIGVTLLARILGALNKNSLTEQLAKYQARYDNLENSIQDSGVDVEKLKECLRLLKERYLTSSFDDQSRIEKELLDLKFNYY